MLKQCFKDVVLNIKFFLNSLLCFYFMCTLHITNYRISVITIPDFMSKGTVLLALETKLKSG